MSERYDLREETKAICAKLGLRPEDVLMLEWTPSKMAARVLERDESGRPFLVYNEVACETLEFEVIA